MEETPLISIIIPCYNQARFLSETLDTIVAQTYSNWECIIVNDGSVDKTETIALQYCSQYPHIKYFYKENGGQSSARNLGLAVAQGEYIQFLDSDDLLHPQKLELSLNEALQTNADIVQTRFVLCTTDESDKVFSLKSRVRLKNNQFLDILCNWDKSLILPIHTLLIKREVIGPTRFDTSLPAQEDLNFHLAIFKIQRKVVFIDRPLAIYRIGHSSVSSDSTKLVRGTFKVYNRYFKNAGIYVRFLILFNFAYRIADWTGRTFQTHQNVLGKNLRVWLGEWQHDKSWMISGLLLFPLGLIQKIILVVKNRLVR